MRRRRAARRGRRRHRCGLQRLAQHQRVAHLNSSCSFGLRIIGGGGRTRSGARAGQAMSGLRRGDLQEADERHEAEREPVCLHQRVVAREHVADERPAARRDRRARVRRLEEERGTRGRTGLKQLALRLIHHRLLLLLSDTDTSIVSSKVLTRIGAQVARERHTDMREGRGHAAAIDAQANGYHRVQVCSNQFEHIGRERERVEVRVRVRVRRLVGSESESSEGLLIRD